MKTESGKEFLMAEIENHFRRNALPISAQAACLPWAMSVVLVCRQYGLNPMLQAGSASWPLIPPSLDDGICNTHFSYFFEQGPAIKVFKQGLFPEMHVWVVLPDENVLIDMTTQFQPEQSLKLIGKEFHPEVIPPRIYWGSYEDLPAGWMYRAEPLAIAMALTLAEEIMKAGVAA